ncbi:hypothetical protein OSCT_1006 [Oscillochloris trichoides DG-6]|uniref:YYY membrane protein n=1 Tax=Oscillochloris trichoides DG-6 TaxID=765420 RepID=E1ICF5_9CHLR|nr:DUF2298 domain-containing protein [Oscillochloris trichoides]EFO81150.1 hypothetical protein OSCT_1006 [Oscillochloris trichoides DG-6]
MSTAILIWWLVAQAVGLLGLPYVRLLFGHLPDAGYPFAKPLGLLLLGYVAWLLAMLGLGRFGVPLLVICILLLGGFGIWLWRHTPTRPLPTRANLIGYEAIFLLALLAFLWMRSYDPTPWGTERAMDFAFFNAIQRSPSFPPLDPWLAGYSINYYYFGYLLMAVMAQLSGLAPNLAYNFALALIVALTAQGVVGLVRSMIAMAGGRGWPSWLAGGLGAVLVLVAGNQSGAIQVLLGDERAVVLDGAQLLTAVGQVLGGATQIELASPVPTGEFGDLRGWERRDMAVPGAFNWWWPSRSLWDRYTLRDEEPPREELRYAITEFPFFSFRLGDMHPHVMALPFGLLAMALAAAVQRSEDSAASAPLLRATTLLLSGLVLGSLYAINSWDLPTYMLLYAGAMLLAYRSASPFPWRTFTRHLGLVVLLSFLLFLPFYLTFRSLVGGADPLINLPILSKLSSIIGFYPATRSGLHAFLIIFGLFALPIIALVYLVPQPSTPRIVRWLPPVLLLAGLLLGFPLLSIFGLGLLAFSIALDHPHDPAQRFALLLTTLGCAIIFGTEIIYIRDVFEGWSARFNTIFKFYYQVWLLWGTLTPFALWYILVRTRGLRRVVGIATATFCALFLVGASVYPVLALRDMQLGQQRDLNAPTPREQSSAEAEAISWLRHNAAPGSVVLEAVEITNMTEVLFYAHPPNCGGSYNPEGYAGVSAATGLPTILGWAGHESQWRGGDPGAAAQLSPRCADVYRIYTSNDLAETQRLLDQYAVRYIYVGDLERTDYPPESLAKFAQFATPISFGNGEVIIYVRDTKR